MNYIFTSLALFYFIGVCVAGDSTTVSAGSRYNKGFLHRIIFGNHYRKLWSTPVTAELLDVTREGYLQPLKKGGNLESKNLRMISSDGRQYYLRLLLKDPSKSLPSFFRKGISGNLIRDQNSAANPYAALIIPYLSEALGIFHAYPKLVYIPADERLGAYAAEFSNSLALLEIRPDKQSEEDYRLGRALKVVSTKRLLKAVYSSNDAEVDQRLFLKCRLFDMLLSDWGRHEDQWRWAAYQNNDKVIYKPIPRDRDHAMYKFNDGIIPWLLVHSYQKKFQSFNKTYHNIRGLNLSAEFLDQRFLNALTLNDWIDVTKEIQKQLSDSVIEAAVKKWPSEVYNVEGSSTIHILKKRRDRLMKASYKHYKILSKEVLIPGTDRNELFVVNRMSSKQTSVLVLASYDAIVSNDQLMEVSDTIYYRVFDHDKTKRLKLYGLKGSDVFLVNGKTKRGLMLTLIGGEGVDRYLDNSYVKGLKQNTVIADQQQESVISAGKETEIIRENKLSNYYFDRKGYRKRKHLKKVE